MQITHHYSSDSTKVKSYSVQMFRIQTTAVNGII